MVAKVDHVTCVMSPGSCKLTGCVVTLDTMTPHSHVPYIPYIRHV